MAMRINMSNKGHKKRKFSSIGRMSGLQIVEEDLFGSEELNQKSKNSKKKNKKKHGGKKSKIEDTDSHDQVQGEVPPNIYESAQISKDVSSELQEQSSSHGNFKRDREKRQEPKSSQRGRPESASNRPLPTTRGSRQMSDSGHYDVKRRYNNHYQSSRADNQYSDRNMHYDNRYRNERPDLQCRHETLRHDCNACWEKLVKYSKGLSNILRHDAHRVGLNMDSSGYVDVTELLRLKRFGGCTVNDLKIIVEYDSKKRFSLKETESSLRICANQGHSFEVEDLDLEEIIDPAKYGIVVHGTYYEAWAQIKKTGLCRMNRQYIHFCNGHPGERKIISGARESANVLIYISMERALQDGYKFYRSKNDVILCPGDKDGYLPSQYFDKVVDRYQGYRSLFP